ncbi:carbon monoxide dehydrogenase [Granulicella sp. 5B5]|uniref:FAD binding domain-containing protein n=1 Tax=Granulicella sp. 5B5 TaxID=1617967 RepID=UPI0015F48FBC|nr:xanthine dehydrogenase family protein subunit M [Granulicella sp. 5B5]QMV18292.1 carbon monoxide dehydrogenase [Granulicella sp. 5B5]
MHSDVSQFDLTAPHTLDAALRLLAEGGHAPIAGGTELMVALGAGRLTPKSLISIQHLRELRFIRADDNAIHIGSGTTFTDIRRNPDIARDLPLLIQSASWTGSIANQNRATLGGNICNASPAADTPPALLAYNATVTLISSTGTRTIPYTDFHLGYKRTALQPNELLHTITIPRAFAGYRHYIRKVGTRNAQAISKIALAAVAKLNNNTITDIRLGAASLTDRPTRCTATERALLNQPINEATIKSARAALASETHTIDDIRSTARYRATVAGNLLEEFLRSLVR